MLAPAHLDSLPVHCTPTHPILHHLSSALQICLPTPLALVSSTLGLLSITAWLFAQLPQIYKNYTLASTSGLSILFLLEWCAGDLANLLGALFTHQAGWQVAVGAYYVLVDACLVAQWVWYERLKHGRTWRMRMWRSNGGGNGRQDSWSDSGMEQVVIEGVVVGASPATENGAATPVESRIGNGKDGTQPKVIFRAPTFEKGTENEKGSLGRSATPNGTTIYRAGAPSSSPVPSPSPRTILLVACLLAIANASPIHRLQIPETTTSTGREPTGLENAGTILSWLSTILYLGSRIPQLLKNWRRKSTAGLSPHLFAAAFCGNLFYSSALLTNPKAWSDYPPYGGGGWAGPEGSERTQWVAAALPFFLGAAGVLGLDASVGVQFLMYGERGVKVVAVEDPRDHRWRWRRVSGWMRGWVPSISEVDKVVVEREALLDRTAERGDGYGAIG